MKRLILPTALLLLATACESSETADLPSAPLGSGVLLDNMDTSVLPGDDFSRYVNGAWMDRTAIPADRDRIGAFIDLREDSQEDTRQIIEDMAEGDYVPGSKRQKVGDLYSSYMDMETRNLLGVSPLQEEFRKIQSIRNREQLARYFASATRIRINVPIGIGQAPDFRDPSHYMMIAGQGGIGLPDREYYFKEGEASEKIRSTYVAHIEKMFDLAGLPDGSRAADMIMDLETRIASHHRTKEKNRDMVALYNPYAPDELSDLMPDFAWDAYLPEAGIANIDTLVVMQPDYVEALNEIVEDTSLEEWKTYLTWTVLNTDAGLLSDELDRANFDFYSTVLRGVEEPLPRWRRGTNVVNASLGEVVGEEYVARHYPEEAKKRMLELIDNLIKAYEVSIKDLDWMGEETRAQALDKLAKFHPMIGYPDEWKDYENLDIERTDLVGNLHRSRESVYQEHLDRQDGPVDRDEWGMTPQTVNAYYNPMLNEIVFPAAILQPPFFDMTADDAVNYGGIGAVIGHEIGHGFDDQGSTFDGDGVLRNWWTDEDRAEFKKRTNALVAQYSAFQPFDDLHLNGEFTLGENIGDLGGVSIALLAYTLSLDGKEPPVIDGFTGYQRFFIGWGQGWRIKIRTEAQRTQIATDPHSPAVYRVNGVVRNVPDFYTAFDVTPSEALYLPPEERVKIW